MKKTLAAVLAAMMALSTATVALAKDTDVDATVDSDFGVLVTDEATVTPVDFGVNEKFALQVGDKSLSELGWALMMEEIKVDVTVTDGRSLLAAAPTVKLYETAKGSKDYRAVLCFKVKHTYGVDAEDIAMRVRVTALKDSEAMGLKKGDTLSVDEILFEANYYEITNYGKDMTITATEVASNNVVVDASDLIAKLEEKETETATFYFGDTAAFTAKISDAQKDVNVYYVTGVDDKYYEEYPELAFEAIEFKGSPKFLRKGTLTFNAIGDEDTVVYEVTKDGLVELEIADYDSTYETVTVEGINKLTSYLVASEALEVEAEVEAPETPAVEENPNTGAC